MLLNDEVEIAEFIKENHPFFKDIKLWRILKYLRKFKGDIGIEREDGIVGIFLYLVNDKNIVFVALVSLKIKTILRGLRNVIEKHSPDRMTWTGDYSGRKRTIILEKGGSLWGNYSLTRLA